MIRTNSRSHHRTEVSRFWVWKENTGVMTRATPQQPARSMKHTAFQPPRTRRRTPTTRTRPARRLACERDGRIQIVLLRPPVHHHAGAGRVKELRSARIAAACRRVRSFHQTPCSFSCMHIVDIDKLSLIQRPPLTATIPHPRPHGWLTT
jgi:hypothetical protein